MDQLTGDIILVRGHGVISNLSIGLQCLTNSGAARFSHAMLCYLPGLLVHSDAEGVHISTYFELFPSVYSDSEMVALRRRDMDRIIGEGSPPLWSQFQNRADYYLGQAYNPAFILKEHLDTHDTNSFCSELLAKVYRDIGLPLLPREPHWTFPVHLESLQSNPDWVDATPAYRWPPSCGHQASLEATKARVTTIIEVIKSTFELQHMALDLTEFVLAIDRTIRGPNVEPVIDEQGLARMRELLTNWYWDGFHRKPHMPRG